MSKKIAWDQPKITSAKPAGTYSSFAEFFEKANKLRKEQEQAQAYLAKAMPAMLKLLEIRMTNHEPITVMRPLRYQTSCLKSDTEDELDKSFYNNDKNPQMDTFIDVVKTINPGTQLILKSLDPHLREFIFKDAEEKEHCISYDDRNALLTQTDIFETVRNLLENYKGD